MEGEATGGRAGIDGVGQTSKPHSPLLKLADEVYKMLDATAEPVQFPNDKGVSCAKALTSLNEPGALGPASTHPILEDLPGSSLL